MQVSEILKVKGNALFTIAPEGKLTDAVSVMAQHNMGSLVVIDKGRMVGMLTFKEVLMALDERRGALDDARVRDTMEHDPVTASPAMEVNDLRRIMIESGARYLPVMDRDKLLGVGDRQLLANLKAHVVAVASEEHNVGHPEALERSARYIEATLSGLGYAVSRQEFETEGVKVRNLEVRRTGPGAGKARLVVIGAHYDSAQGAVGADDNGSGGAAPGGALPLAQSGPAPGGRGLRAGFCGHARGRW